MIEWLPLAAMALGALEGGDREGRTSTENREPWGPAQPYILDNLKTNKKLQDFYQQNPFNPQQQASYQNIFGDIDNYRQNIAPGLMDFANNAMGSSYQRQRGGEVGSGGGYGGAVQPGGLLRNQQPHPFRSQPGQSYGLVDFNAQNPYRNGAIKPDPVVAQPARATELYSAVNDQIPY